MTERTVDRILMVALVVMLMVAGYLFIDWLFYIVQFLPTRGAA